MSGSGPAPTWTLVTSHGLVLVYVALNPDATIREIASDLNLTERRVADVIRDLAAAGLMQVRREGRRNHYTVSPNARFRHSVIADIPFVAFVRLLKWLRQTAGREPWGSVVDGAPEAGGRYEAPAKDTAVLP